MVGVEVVRVEVMRMRMNVMVKVARMKLVAVCWVLRCGGEVISLVEDEMLPFTLLSQFSFECRRRPDMTVMSGFVYLRGHGLEDSDLVKAAMEASRTFFLQVCTFF